MTSYSRDVGMFNSMRHQLANQDFSFDPFVKDEAKKYLQQIEVETKSKEK